MTKPITFDVYPSIEWIDKPEDVDHSIIPDGEMVSKTASESIIVPIMESEVSKLFEFDNPIPWASFKEFYGFEKKVKRAFRKKILASIDCEFVLETLDNISINEGLEEGEIAFLYEMITELNQLNQLFEEIGVKLLSCLRS